MALASLLPFKGPGVSRAPSPSLALVIHSPYEIYYTRVHKNHRQCCGSGSGIRDRVLFDPWIRDPEYVFSGSRISDPGSQDHIFKSFLTIFLVKSSIVLWKLAQILFLQHFKAKIIYNFVKSLATKRYENYFFFTSLFCCCFWIRDPRSGIRDLGSGMGKNQDPGSGINIPDPQHWS